MLSRSHSSSGLYRDVLDVTDEITSDHFLLESWRGGLCYPDSFVNNHAVCSTCYSCLWTATARARDPLLCWIPHNLITDVEDGTHFDRSTCLRGDKEGFQHMLQLKLIHNDLNPSNIMIDRENPMIIDFDSSRQEVVRFDSKRETHGKTLDADDYAKRENDLYSLFRINLEKN